MFSKFKISDFTFIVEKGSTFVEYYNSDYSIHSHFNIDKDSDFKESCITFYNKHLK